MTGADRANYRVVKTLRPTDRGAIEWERKYGKALVCVRHRTDAKGRVRHTTVELVVQSRPITIRSAKQVWIRIALYERDLRAVIETAGGVWDGRRRAWRLPSRVVSILKLRDRIVAM
jgi:hypothetical protein